MGPLNVSDLYMANDPARFPKVDLSPEWHLVNWGKPVLGYALEHTGHSEYRQSELVITVWKEVNHIHSCEHNIVNLS